MKKTNKIITALLIFTVALFTSCSNDDDNKESFGTTTGDFLPLAINNNWKYFDADQSLLTEVDIIGTTTFGGKTYYEYTDDSDAQEVQHWFAKKGATHLLKYGNTTINQSGINITIQGYEVPILKDDFAVNDSWTGTISPKVTYSGNGQSGSLPFKVNYTGTNYFKGELLLNGITYPNVIKTRMNISINANGQITNATEEYWYAENVGIINYITVNADSSVSEKVIDSYTLN